ncbi:MAG: formate dehydrogenase accessory protein FdhE [bacterium]|nr:formate dehydrogenase accessory protein FdhE [bacterium]
MTRNFALSPDQVNKAVEALIKNNPAYADMLGFYGRIFVAQKESTARLQIEPLQIPNDVLTVKAQEKFPLIEVKDFPYDKDESVSLFVTICNLAKEANPKLAASAAVLLNSDDRDLKPEGLINALLNGNEAIFENITGKFEIEKQILGLITYHSLRPSICTGAIQLAAYLKKDEPWLKGYCPICGSAPILSILEGEGARSLICSFCWHQWPVKRVYCPFCDNSDNKNLHYIFSEEEKDLRVDLCNKCNKYLKTIDTRRTDRLIYPPLEQVATLHLDIKAREEGFEPGVRLFLES